MSLFGRAGAAPVGASARHGVDQSPEEKAIITVSLIAATVLQSLDNTIANVALPHMQGALSASQDQMGWVLTSYIIAAAVTIPLAGWLANAVGRRTVLLTSVLVFTVSSALCGMVTSLPELVLFRLLQGAGGAAIIPLSQAVLFSINEPRDYPRAMALWAGAAQLGAIIGPALGGWLTEYLSWRWAFYVNVPVGILAVIGLLTLREPPLPERSRFDFMGFIALSLAVGALQLMLDRGQQLDWFSSAEIVAEALIAGLALWIFGVHMFTTDRPFLNAALFRDGNFMASIVFTAVVGVVLFASLALLAPMLQNEFNYPVLLTGLITAPRGVGTLIGMAVIPRLIGRFDVRLVIVTGLFVIAVSLWQMSRFSPEMTYGPVILSGLVQGFGIAIVYVPVSTTAFATLAPHLRNEGTAFFSLMRNLGSSAGISVVFFLLTRNTQTVHASLTELVRLPSSDPASLAIAARVDPLAPSTLAGWNELITRQSVFIAYLDDFRLMLLLTVATMPLVFLLRGRRGAASGATVID